MNTPTKNNIKLCSEILGIAVSSGSPSSAENVIFSLFNVAYKDGKLPTFSSKLILADQFIPALRGCWRTNFLQIHEQFHVPKNIIRQTAHTIVSWPDPKQWLMIHTSDVMRIKHMCYTLMPCSGPRLNIKTVLSTYGDFHVKDKTAVRTSYL